MIKLREEDGKSGGKRKRGLIGKVIEMIFSYFFAWLGHRTCVNIARKEKKKKSTNCTDRAIYNYPRA